MIQRKWTDTKWSHRKWCDANWSPQSELIESDLTQSEFIESDPTCNIFANAPSLGGAVVSSCAAFCVSLPHRMHYWMIYVSHAHTLGFAGSRTLLFIVANSKYTQTAAEWKPPGSASTTPTHRIDSQGAAQELTLAPPREGCIYKVNSWKVTSHKMVSHKVTSHKVNS